MPSRPSVPRAKPSQGSPADADLFARFRTYRATRDVTLRDQLVCEHLYLVYSVVRRFNTVGEPVEDLVQEGSIGLMNAIDLYNPELGVKFSTYATHLITGQIQHYLRDCGHLIRQPAWVQELDVKVTRAQNKLRQALEREPEAAEVAAELGLTEESILEILSARELKRVVSLSAPEGTELEMDFLLVDKEKIRSSRHSTLQLPIEDRIVLDEAISKLKALEQKVVRLAFFSDMNQSEIARKLGISPHYSSYLLRRSISRMKTNIEEEQQREEVAWQQARPTTPPRHAQAPIYDRETGLHSAAYLRAVVSDEIDRSLQVSFSIILVELRGLTVPSTQQRQVIVALGRLLRDSVHSTDYIAYLGNLRYALMLPRTGREVRVVAERLTKLIADRREQLAPGQPDLHLAAGQAVFPTDGVSMERLFARAEQAMPAE